MAMNFGRNIAQFSLDGVLPSSLKYLKCSWTLGRRFIECSSITSKEGTSGVMTHKGPANFHLPNGGSHRKDKADLKEILNWLSYRAK